MRAPWAFRVGPADATTFHLIRAGSACVTLDGREPIPVRAGDVVVLPRGHAHAVANPPGAPVVPLERLIREHASADGARISYGGTGATTRLLCGGVAAAGALPDATLALVPDVLRLESSAVPAAAWLERMLELLNAEADGGQPGSSAVLAKIADVFLTQALRAWLLEAQSAGLLARGQIRDRPVAEAIRTIRSRPGERWTLDRLAREVGLARTALATGFQALVGEPPMRYLTKVRLEQAASCLATSQMSIRDVARRSGYDDVAAFSRAFKRRFGRAPGDYRRSAARAPDIPVV